MATGRPTWDVTRVTPGPDLGALQTGAADVPPGGFDPAGMLDQFQAEHGTLMLSVPTMLIRVLDGQSVRPRDVSSSRLTMLGGAPVAPELGRRAQEQLGVDVSIGFGQTEVCTPRPPPG